MLNIFNNLRFFFEDCYRRISVREYSKLVNISPPTASSRLESYFQEGLLKKIRDRNYILFWANRESKVFVGLTRVYWLIRFYESGLLDYLKKTLTSPSIILFGSLAKAENRVDSDIDLALISYKKKLDLKIFEKKLKRKIHIVYFGSAKSVEIRTNIINGSVLVGKIKNGS